MSRILNQEKGFSIIEATVAQVILIIGAICLLGLIAVGSRLNAESEDKTVAANIAQLKMEEIMETRYGYRLGSNGELIPNPVVEHPPQEKYFKELEPRPPYWTLNSEGKWIESLPEGRYRISYPDYPPTADPLRIRLTISWRDSHTGRDTSLDLETLLSVIPGPISQMME
jgi:hypothetical protein